MVECLLRVQKKLWYTSAIYERVLAICSISGALKNVILFLRTVLSCSNKAGLDRTVKQRLEIVNNVLLSTQMLFNLYRIKSCWVTLLWSWPRPLLAVVAVRSDRWSLNFHGASAAENAAVSRQNPESESCAISHSLPRNQYSGRKESLLFHERCSDGKPCFLVLR